MADEFTINIRLYTILALGVNPYLHEEIDTIYEENKLDYYRAYKISGFYDDPSFKTYMLDKEVRMKKVAGIVEWGYAHNDLTLVYKLIKKGYKFSWNYIQNKKQVSIDEFAFSFEKRKGKSSIESEMYLFYHGIILIYLGYQAKIHVSLDSEYGQYFQKLFYNHTKHVFAKEFLFTERNFEEYRARIEDLSDEFVVQSKKQSITLEMLFSDIITEETNQLLPKTTLTASKYESVRSQVFKQGISKYIGFYSGWLKAMGFNETDLTASSLLTKEELNGVFLQFLAGMDMNGLEESEREHAVVALLFLQALSKGYQQAKENYFNQLQDNFFFEMEEYEKELAKQEETLKQANASFEVEKKKIQTENDNVWGELRRLQAENKALREKTESMEDHKKEVFALREFIYLNEKAEEESNETEEIELMTEYLSTKKVAIVGGSVSWQKTIKEHFPNFKLFNPDEINKDLKGLDKMEVVIVNTRTFNHSFYERVMKQLSKNEAKLKYLNDNNNITIATKEIYTLVQSAETLG